MGNPINMELRKFVIPEIITGLDARLLIGRYIIHFEAKKPMVVTDHGVRKTPWFEGILDEIRNHTDDLVVFDDITPNPKDYEAMMGAELFLANDCDLIIAIGGGSPMDCAKCISIVSTNGGNIIDYEGVDEIRLPGPPLICIPTTSGTSADVSQFAIICDTMSSVKKAIISKKVVPDLALIDPIPLMSMDPYLTACTGMDALTHAIEAYVSNAASALTDVHALEAIRLINIHLEAAIKPNRAVETMYGMMMASLNAGLAFSNASLGAVHALAHSLGGVYDLPHGECNSVLLEPVIEMNFDSVPKRYADIAQALGISLEALSQIDIKRRLLGKISLLRSNVGIAPTIEVAELTEELMGKIVMGALEDPCIITNPKKVSGEEAKEIYDRILQTKA